MDQEILGKTAPSPGLKVSVTFSELLIKTASPIERGWLFG